MKLFERIKSLFKKPKKEDVKDFRALKSQAIKELDKIKKRGSKEKTLEKLNRIFRIFIEERYELKRSLTYEELNRKITSVKINNKIKKKIIEVASNIYQTTYKKDPKKMKKKNNNLNNLFKEVGSVVKNS